METRRKFNVKPSSPKKSKSLFSQHSDILNTRRYESNVESKLRDTYSEKQYCPNCQVPFDCLIGQSINCHVDECLQVNHNFLPECTDCDCNSTIPSHYNKFSHFRLAAMRSNAVIKIEKTVINDQSYHLLNHNNNNSGNNRCDVIVKKNNKLSLKRKHSSSSVPPPKRLLTKKISVGLRVNTEMRQLTCEVEASNPASNTTSLDQPNVTRSKNVNTELITQSQSINLRKRTSQTTLTSYFKSIKVEQNIPTANETSDINSKLKLQENLKLSQNSQGSSTSEELKRRGKNCPFFKKIPDTSFSVDAFSYGSIPGIKYYFLSHFHYDHYCGLKASFPHPIYCSKVTANLVLSKIKVQRKLLHVLNLNEPIVIDSVEITALDANHCPGSLMFLFELSDGRRFLHTGDFRASPEMETYSSLLRAPINELYLDTTYCDPHYKFPPQQAILEYVASLVANNVTSKPNTLIVCGSYTIGKEKVFVAIAEALNCKIWANPAKLKVIGCLEDEQINRRLVSAPSEARVHVLPMNKLNYPSLCQHLQQSFNNKYTEILAIKPTGWEYNSKFKVDNINANKPKTSGPVSIYGIPYSEHSSIDELKRFVQFIRPHCVIPTVSSTKEERNDMNKLFRKWLKL